MTKEVRVTVDIPIARRMLAIAGFYKEAKEASDDEIFAKVLSILEKYGAKSEIIEERINEAGFSE
jgi:hypothetical protein